MTGGLLLPLAEHGNALAQTYVGFMYANGRGLPQDMQFTRSPA
jgi:TPR repeat protein